MTSAYSLELNPGECITLNETQICAKNTTIDENVVCTSWLNSNLTNTIGNVSFDMKTIRDQIVYYCSDIKADMNTSFLDIKSYVSSVGLLSNYTDCLSSLSDRETTLKARNIELDNCRNEKSQIESDLSEKFNKTVSDMYTYIPIAFVAGIGIYWFVTRKVVPKRLELETHEGKRGF